MTVKLEYVIRFAGTMYYLTVDNAIGAIHDAVTFDNMNEVIQALETLEPGMYSPETLVTVKEDDRKETLPFPSE
jgi:hypothetical protein